MPDDVEQVPARRPSRFDRPKEPHDWRWVLGIVGRTLISVGILMFAFVAYQLWGTGIQTAREQARLRAEFDQMLESTVPMPTVPVTTLPPSSSIVPPASTTPVQATTTVAPTTIVPAAVISAPEEGQGVARLQIPAMGIEDKIVVEGVSPTDLQDGPGHFPETPLPGQLGNAAIAGHRTTHGEPFNKIDQLKVGDEITVITLAGKYVYRVTGTVIVDPGDYELVIPTIDPTKATLTLTSCHPKLKSTHRIVVMSELDASQSSPVTLPSTKLGEPTSVLPGDDAPEATVATVATDTATTDAAVVPSATVETEPATTEPAAPVAVVEAPSDSRDAFANKWFSEPSAFPQVALWGIILTAIAIGAYQLSRRVRRNWVGALVGIVPFLVVLYFFFENVNRLLPPNL